jgi:hypothetical protein
MNSVKCVAVVVDPSGELSRRTAGAVESTSSVTEVEVRLPAGSTAVPLINCCAPSPATTGSGHATTPESSAHSNVTVTGAVNHAPRLAGDTLATIVGGVMSIV